jgi:poly(ADP-ribose) glycohydrolase ARH3
MMTKIDLSLFGKKFRGSILGVLTGDCLGSPYENEELSSGSKLVLQNFFDKLEGPIFKGIFKINYFHSRFLHYILI